MKPDKTQLIREIEAFPARLEKLVGGLTEEVVSSVSGETAVSSNEWSIAQIIHHLADSHSWGLMRCKKVLTEEAPIIASYHQDSFAQLADGQDSNMMASLNILSGIHARWAILLRSLEDDDWWRTEVHVEFDPWQLTDLVANYVRHGHSHLEQLKEVLASHQDG